MFRRQAILDWDDFVWPIIDAPDDRFLPLPGIRPPRGEQQFTAPPGVVATLRVGRRKVKKGLGSVIAIGMANGNSAPPSCRASACLPVAGLVMAVRRDN